MGKLRVLIVDDSAVVRESLARMINSHPDMEVMDVASNPYIAAKKIQMEIPDVITLDVEMPKMDGITFLRKIMLQHPIPVIIISSLTEKGTHSAIKALEYGAVDVLPKPDLYNETAINSSQDYLCEIIKGASSAKLQKIELNKICKKRNIENTPKRITSKSLIKTSEKVIAIGASTGGTEVIKEILQSMPVDCPGIIIVQHMPELFTRSFARRLDEICEITVKEAENNDKVQRGKALIAPGNRHIELKRKQAALTESEAKYRLLAENSGDVIFTLDFDLNYTFVSPAIFSLRGYKPNEIINKKISDTLTPQSNKKVKEIYDGYLPVITEGKTSVEPMVVELETYHKNGSTIWVEIKVSVSYDKNGNPIGILGVSRDITKRKAAEKELKKLSRAVTQSPVSVSITNVDGEIEYVNPQFVKLTGYTFEEVKGKNPRILKSGKHDDKVYNKLWRTILSGDEWHGELQNKKKNGDLYWVSSSISPLVNDEGEITHFVAVKEDITEKKKVLDDLIEAKEKAEAANRLKTAFMNNISHEIRTPLNGILGFGEMLLSPNLSENDKNLGLGVLQKSSKRLINTITDFMDISLIVSRNVEVNKKLFDVHEVLQTIYEQFIAEANEKELELRLETGNSKISKIETDPELLKKILSHLLNNAIKFTEDGKIEFGYEYKDKQIEFIVHDNGTGIEQEKIDSIFDFFTQGEVGLTRGYEGSGLGLSISKGLVELLDGEISLQSEKGKGTTVSFALPWAPEETEHETQESLKQPAGSNLVLIAEDDSMNRLFMETILERAGLQFISVEDGKQAVDKCRENPEIGIVLMDLKMPVMDGYEATRQIKAFKPELPVIAITAQAMQGDREKAINAGCNDYSSKPLDRSRLIALIKSYYQ